MAAVLCKVSLYYSAIEDRLCLVGNADSGAPLSFWLTLRLSRLLATQLIKFVERATPASAAHEALLAFEQTAAELQNAPTEPVAPCEQHPPLLLSRVDLNESNGHLTLRFPLPGEDSACLTFSPTQTRQWIGILYRQFIAAGWPLDDWPDWMANELQPQTAPPPTAARLH